MVYRLRCPHCGTTEDHAFVRPGAVTVCARCHTIWRIEPAQVQRLASPADRPAPATPPASPELPAAPRRRAPGDSTLGESADDTSIVGLSGLSEMMRGPAETELAPEPDPTTTGTPPGTPPGIPPGISPGMVAGPVSGPRAPADPASTARPVDPPSPRQFRQQQAQQLAQRRALEAARRRRRRTTLVLLGALTVMVGSLGVAVALLAAKPPPQPDPLGSATDPAEPAVVRIRAQAMGLQDPRLVQPAEPSIRAVVELLHQDAPQRLEPDELALRLTTTALDDRTRPGPIRLIITAAHAGQRIGAWEATDPRDLPPRQPHRLVVVLQDFPAMADPLDWIVTAMPPAAHPLQAPHAAQP